MDEKTAILRARRYLQERGVTTAPVDVTGLAAAEGFEVKFVELPADEAGSTLERRGKRYILVNEKDPPMRQRFTILHEIAHHVLELPSVHGKTEKAENEALKSQGRRPPEESLCDAFASECLVPWAVLTPLIEGQSFGVQTVAYLAKRFEASLHCIASQFIKASDECVAFVVAERGRITLAFPSTALRAAGVHLLRGTNVPNGSAAETLMSAEDGAVFTADSDGTDWSHSDPAKRFSVHEEASFYAPKLQTYSFLTFEALEPARPSTHASTASDSEALLSELTGELVFKSRKG